MHIATPTSGVQKKTRFVGREEGRTHLLLALVI